MKAVSDYNSFDVNAVKDKKGRIISSREALEDVKVIEWDKKRSDGKKITAVPKNSYNKL